MIITDNFGHNHIEFELNDEVFVDVSRHDRRKEWKDDYFVGFGHGDEWQLATVLEVQKQGLFYSPRIKVKLRKTYEVFEFWTTAEHVHSTK